MKRFFLAISAIFLIILSAVLYDVSSASAYSVYDQAYRTTDDLYYQGTSCNEPQSAIYWMAILNDYNSYFYDGPNPEEFIDSQRTKVIDNLNEALQNGGVAVSMTDSVNGLVKIFIAPDGGTLRFINTGSSMNPVYSVYIDSPENVLVVTLGKTSSGGSVPCDKPIIANIGSNIGEIDSIYSLVISNQPNSVYGNILNYFAEGFDIEYPANYEGEPINEIDPGYTEQKILQPNYTWKVAADGNLTITYDNNIQPTLTGFVYPVIEKMTDDWAGLDTNLQANHGWRMQNFNRSFMLPGEGYYMFRMDYDDTFESPPWEENADKLYEVDQIWVQFYWDGESVITGTTIGCESGEICNPLKQKKSKAERILSSIGIPVYGLQQLMLSPLGYLAELSTSTNNCTPLTLPLGFGLQNAYLPCMTPIYRDHFGTILIIYQTILIGLFAYYVGLRSFGNIKDMSNPRNDQIETAKL